MGSKLWSLEMAQYNRWQNETLYRLCADLEDSDRKQARGMFFDSIHYTLDHILMVDLRLRTFVVTGHPPAETFEPRKRLYSDYDELTRERVLFDEGLIELFSTQHETWLDDMITFTMQGVQRHRTIPRFFYAAQLFNHATHHRSQVTSELTKLGIDYGSTDLPMNPYSQF